MERLKFVSNMNSRLKDERVYKDSENCYNIRMDHRETVRGCGLDASGSGYGPMASSCEHVNELLGSMKGRKLN